MQYANPSNSNDYNQAYNNHNAKGRRMYMKYLIVMTLIILYCILLYATFWSEKLPQTMEESLGFSKIH